jgi:hypothetical protein
MSEFGFGHSREYVAGDDLRAHGEAGVANGSLRVWTPVAQSGNRCARPDSAHRSAGAKLRSFDCARRIDEKLRTGMYHSTRGACPVQRNVHLHRPHVQRLAGNSTIKYPDMTVSEQYLVFNHHDREDLMSSAIRSQDLFAARTRPRG